MKPFLKELSEKIFKAHAKLSDVTIVFPNRRASLYFRKYLSELITKPVFAPQLFTIEDFITQFSSLRVPDKLELVSKLHVCYNEIIRREYQTSNDTETFDRFYFWGDMLLRDFDEADKYMINADHLFRDLSHQKELDTSFDFFTDEQKEFLKNFWSNFDEHDSVNKRKFLQVWKQLPSVYHHYKQQLSSSGLAYEGMLHREVAKAMKQGVLDSRLVQFKHINFVGFNALTRAEETIITTLVDRFGAQVHWDVDQYYVNNKTQEAGKFFREYQEHPVLKQTFADSPSNFISKRSSESKVMLYGAAQPIGQAKLMAEVLNDHLKEINPEETLIVLPDEKLLMPVLHGIAGITDKFNVTMGFPLSSTPLFNLIEILIDLQLTRKHDHFNHREVLAVLGHPYIIAANAVSANNKRKEILKQNWVHIPISFLATEVDLHRIIFRDFLITNNVNSDIIQYLKAITQTIGSIATLSNFDKEYAFHFIKFFNRIEEVIGDKSEDIIELDSRLTKGQLKTSLKSFLRLFRQLVQAQKIPFTGEPLKGLQIMGVLETRNLDFKNVFILSLNEGAFPAMSSKGSYIPFNIRKAYGLPTVEHQDAIYSYLFYRLLQRAENIYMFYNSETDVLGQGEMSRYLQQLLYESGIPVEKKILHNPIQPIDINPIVVNKNAVVLEEIMKLNEGNSFFRGISPSALNTYIECRLRFYFRHVAKIREPNEVEEELDARVLGNFLHDVMEKFYKTIRDKKKSRDIAFEDFSGYEEIVDRLIDQVFISEYKLDPSRPVVYEGQRLVVKEIVKRFAYRIIEMDKSYAPFTIEGLEQGGLTYDLSITKTPYKAVIGGKIDRVDRKDNLVRVIDYKTGKDKLDFESIESLFSREGKRNKAAFQTLVYALLYKRNFLASPKHAGLKLIPGLINRMNLFDDQFSFGLKVGKEKIEDVEVLLPEFEARIKMVFDELFDPEQPFDQTSELDNCKICPYSQICYR